MFHLPFGSCNCVALVSELFAWFEVIANALSGPTAQAIVGMLDFVVGEEPTEFVVQMDRAPNAPLASHIVADVVAALDLP